MCNPSGSVSPALHRPQHNRYVSDLTHSRIYILAETASRGLVALVARAAIRRSASEAQPCDGTRRSTQNPGVSVLKTIIADLITVPLTLLRLPPPPHCPSCHRPRRAFHLHLRKMRLLVGTVARLCSDATTPLPRRGPLRCSATGHESLGRGVRSETGSCWQGQQDDRTRCPPHSQCR